MQKIEKQQILRVLVGLSVTIGFYWLIDYPLTSSSFIANFIILLLSPTQRIAKTNIKSQLYAQILGVSIGILFALGIHNVYTAVFGILLFVLTLPFWFRIPIPPIPLAIAAYVIFQSDTVADATIERLIVKVVSLAIAFAVAWLFARTYPAEKAYQLLQQQFLQLSQFIHELFWRSPQERREMPLPMIEPLSAAVLQQLPRQAQELAQLNDDLYALQMSLRGNMETLPLIMQQELRFALQIHYQLLNEQTKTKLFSSPIHYHVPQTCLMSTLGMSKPLALTLAYLQQLEQVVQQRQPL